VYRAPAFVEDDATTIVRLARQAGFGHLNVVGVDGSLVSTPVPFLIDDDGRQIRAHLARPNPVWRAAPCRALLVVPVSDTYVSPNWYPSKREHGKVVPTWNYEVVHVHGDLIAHDDPVWIEQQIRDLTDLHESRFDRPWSVDDAPDGYIEKTARGIVGIELAVDRLDGKRKLSQNRDDADTAGVLTALEASDARGADAVAAAMREITET
jgi:transcriptional regulator